MSDLESSSTASATMTARRRVNWSLLAGGAIVGLVLVLAIWGPTLAPKDPREQVLIIQVDGQWFTPPYSAFTPGYPLGSDNLGRDLFSWLLWSLRPTMTLVLIVAGLRMIMGVLIGVVAGWSDRGLGRFSDGLITGALAVPSLIAALIVITAIGFHLGVWAFVVGLAVTGWAESAQLVREQTRTIKAQEAVEAAFALGSSGAQIFFLHILPQVMPMVWMLLAFEVANTLVTTAGLGFLGYYLGGAVFTEVDDFVYQRISEMPELGQMLATAWMVLDEPWAMVAAGTLVFIIVLGFNLVGDGLQSRLTRKLGGARTVYTFFAGDVLPWFDAHVGAPVAALTHQRAFRTAALVLVVAIAGGGLLWWRGGDLSALPPAVATTPEATVASETVAETPTPTAAAAAPAPTSAFDVPGDHIWANEGHDPWATQWVDFTGPMTTTLQWTYDIDGSFSGGPVIDASGMLYIAARTEDATDSESPGMVSALDDDGEVLWTTSLAGLPVGAPALGSDGTVYVVDKGGLNSVSPDGDLNWRLESEDGKPATSGPVVGPDATIYYKSLSGVAAVTASGELRWHAPITETMVALPPHLSPDGSVVHWDGFSFAASDGAPVVSDIPIKLPDEVVVGADGREYLRYGVHLVNVPPDNVSDAEELQAVDSTVFDWRNHTWGGLDAGITPAGRPWLSARPAVGGMGLGFYWGDPDGALASKLSVPNTRNIQVVGVDVNDVAYICMDSERTGPSCTAFGTESDRALWRLPFRGVSALSGAALAPSRLYVATWDGKLMAIGASIAAESESSENAGAQVDSEPGTRIAFGPEPAWERPEVPGHHVWPMPRRDAWGTLWADFAGPQAASNLWAFELPQGAFTGGPAIAADGTIYVGTEAGELLALDPQGATKWHASLAGSAVGAPAIGADGTVYATDGGGYLSAFSPGGQQLWRYHATGVITRTRWSQSGEIISEEPVPLDGLGPAGAGPIVAPDGNLYYSMATAVRYHEINVLFHEEVQLAVSPEGASLLTPPVFTWSERQPPRLAPDPHWLIWGDFNFSATPAIHDDNPDAEAYHDYLRGRLGEDRDLDFRVVVGADGRAYFVEGRTLTPWWLTPTSLEMGETFEWNPDPSPGTAVDGGATPDGLRWLFFRYGTFIWISEQDEVLEPVRFPLESTVIALDMDGTVYGCGSSQGKAAECMAFRVNQPEPLWQIVLEEGERVIGGALDPGVLYVTTNMGRLYALGD